MHVENGNYCDLLWYIVKHILSFALIYFQYAILCGILLILGIIVCVYAFKVVDNDDITSSIKTSFDEMIKKYDSDKDSKAVVDNIQSYVSRNDYLLFFEYL